MSDEPRISQPPKCSANWTPAERLALIAWIMAIGLDRAQRDDPLMPVLATQPILDVLHAVRAIATWSAAGLERNRAALEKPYDPALDHHTMWIVWGRA